MLYLAAQSCKQVAALSQRLHSRLGAVCYAASYVNVTQPSGPCCVPSMPTVIGQGGMLGAQHVSWLQVPACVRMACA